MTAERRPFPILAVVNPKVPPPSARRRAANPAEALAQQVTERVVDLVVGALDVNELAARVDVNAILGRLDIDAMLRKIDLNSLLGQVDVNAILGQVDVNGLAQRIDVAGLAEQADLGAIIAESSGGVAREVLDAVRCQAARLDEVIDRWVGLLLRRKRPAPPALLPAGADS